MWKGAFRWLTQLKIAELFGVQKAAISKHLKNIYSTRELSREATVSKMETVQNEGGRTVVREQEFYNLDVIIAVGYRVNSVMATQFRIWATQVLKTYLLKGYAVNARLAQLVRPGRCRTGPAPQNGRHSKPREFCACVMVSYMILYPHGFHASKVCSGVWSDSFRRLACIAVTSDSRPRLRESCTS